MVASRSWITVPCALALLCSSACSDDVTAPGDDDIGDAETESESDDGPPVLGGPAMGISITGLEANQGVAVELYADGAWLEPNERNTFLIRDRDTLIRVAHVIDDPGSWLPRDLTAFLHILPPGGEEVVRQQQLFVEADSDPRLLSSSFYFGLLSEESLPGTRVWIELRESDIAIDVSGFGEGVHSLVDPAQIGYEEVDLQMKIVVVPVRYEYYDTPTQVDMTPDDLQLFHDQLLQQNPAQTIDIQIRDEPLVWTEQLTNLGNLLGPTRQLRIQDDPAPNVYYHALVDVRGNAVSMVAGIAWLTGPSKDEGSSRVAATVFHKPSSQGEEDPEPTYFPPSNSARTWVHEIGHNQGLNHIKCPNADSAGPDPSYPYADGKIGVFGFGIRNYQLYSPSASHDYMSYCGNTWVSDWTWNKTYTRIQTLTSWDAEGAAPDQPPQKGPILVGFLFADGSERWWAYDDVIPSQPRGAQVLEFWAGDALLASEYADVALLSDGQGVVVTAPLPAAQLGRLDHVVRVDEQGQRRPVALASVRGQVSGLQAR